MSIDSRRHNQLIQSSAIFYRYHWSKFSKLQLKSALMRILAKERVAIFELNAQYYAVIRLALADYYEKNVGGLPKILKVRRVEKDLFWLHSNSEFQKWVRAK